MSVPMPRGAAALRMRKIPCPICGREVSPTSIRDYGGHTQTRQCAADGLRAQMLREGYVPIGAPWGHHSDWKAELHLPALVALRAPFRIVPTRASRAGRTGWKDARELWAPGWAWNLFCGEPQSREWESEEPLGRFHDPRALVALFRWAQNEDNHRALLAVWSAMRHELAGTAAARPDARGALFALFFAARPEVRPRFSEPKKPKPTTRLKEIAIPG